MLARSSILAFICQTYTVSLKEILLINYAEPNVLTISASCLLYSLLSINSLSIWPTISSVKYNNLGLYN